MTTFKIIAKTNSYIAQRDTRIFNGKTEVTLNSGLSIEEAKSKLIEMGEEDYEGEFDIMFHDKNGMSYEYDSRYFSIEEEIEEEFIVVNKNWKIGYTKKIGGLGEIIVKGVNENEALKHAKFNCHTGKDFFLIGLTDEKSNASNTAQGQNNG